MYLASAVLMSKCKHTSTSRRVEKIAPNRYIQLANARKINARACLGLVLLVYPFALSHRAIALVINLLSKFQEAKVNVIKSFQRRRKVFR